MAASHAARLVLLLALAAALAGRSEGTSWCVCRADQPDAALQRTLDYACGTPAADCNPIQKNAACFAPDTVKAHCSYAVNTFFQHSGQNPLACAFAGTAVVSTTDPSTPGCRYPSTSTSTPGAPSPPGPMGPGPSGFMDDKSGGADILPAAGAARRAVILACCSLLALYYFGRA